MFDSYDLTIPAITRRTAPTTQEISLGPGTITRIGIQFPTGCAGLVHCTIHHGPRQVWPTDPDEDIASDGFILWWDESYHIEERSVPIIIVGWNEDEVYPHTPAFYFQVEGPRPPPPPAAPAGIIPRLREALGV